MDVVEVEKYFHWEHNWPSRDRRPKYCLFGRIAEWVEVRTVLSVLARTDYRSRWQLRKRVEIERA